MDQEPKFEGKMFAQAVFVEIRACKWIPKNHQLLRSKSGNNYMNIRCMDTAVSTYSFVTIK